jgi:carbamoyl-phosphate synthase large subunit
MGLDTTFERAFLKAQLGASTPLPSKGTVFISIKNSDKTPLMLEAAQILSSLDFNIIATGGTSKWLADQGVANTKVLKVYEGRPNIVDTLKDGGIDLIFNTTEGTQSLEDSRHIRSAALSDKIAYYTTAAASNAAAKAIRNMSEGEIEVMALQAY